jgi:hypothetical protein
VCSARNSQAAEKLSLAYVRDTLRVSLALTSLLAGWHRIILDEAHTIKNYKSTQAEACDGLFGKYRWCITGSPVQYAVVLLRCSRAGRCLCPFAGIPLTICTRCSDSLTVHPFASTRHFWSLVCLTAARSRDWWRENIGRVKKVTPFGIRLLRVGSNLPSDDL